MSAICLAHKLIPLALIPGANAQGDATQLLLTCVLPVGHLGTHLCGYESWHGDQDLTPYRTEASL